MAEQKPSAKILHIFWGSMEVEGIGSGRDFKLYPGGGREWDWGETGTRHNPGIQPADVEELIENGASIVVLSQGMNSMLQVCPETLQLLEKRGIPFHVKETKEAAVLYNKLAETQPVGGLFHSTC